MDGVQHYCFESVHARPFRKPGNEKRFELMNSVARWTMVPHHLVSNRTMQREEWSAGLPESFWTHNSTVLIDIRQGNRFYTIPCYLGEYDEMGEFDILLGAAAPAEFAFQVGTPVLPEAGGAGAAGSASQGGAAAPSAGSASGAAAPAAPPTGGMSSAAAGKPPRKHDGESNGNDWGEDRSLLNDSAISVLSGLGGLGVSALPVLSAPSSPGRRSEADGALRKGQVPWTPDQDLGGEEPLQKRYQREVQRLKTAGVPLVSETADMSREVSTADKVAKMRVPMYSGLPQESLLFILRVFRMVVPDHNGSLEMTVAEGKLCLLLAMKSLKEGTPAFEMGRQLELQTWLRPGEAHDFTRFCAEVFFTFNSEVDQQVMLRRCHSMRQQAEETVSSYAAKWRAATIGLGRLRDGALATFMVSGLLPASAASELMVGEMAAFDRLGHQPTFDEIFGLLESYGKRKATTLSVVTVEALPAVKVPRVRDRSGATAGGAWRGRGGGMVGGGQRTPAAAVMAVAAVAATPPPSPGRKCFVCQSTAHVAYHCPSKAVPVRGR